jgi:hypothetical protein
LPSSRLFFEIDRRVTPERWPIFLRGKFILSLLPLSIEVLLMRRIDSSRLPFERGSDPITAVSNSWSYVQQSEQSAAAHPVADFADGAALHWENAWIDLGGEG